MAVTLNANTSTGFIATSDTSGVLQLQTGGTAAVSIGTDQSFNFSATGQRITGDFSNATIANRVMFQTSTVNGQTILAALPNGTSQVAGFSAVSSASDPNNSSECVIAVVGGADARFNSSIRGTGTYLPMTFYTGGSERVRIDTSGNVGIGTSSPTGGANRVVDVYGSGSSAINFHNATSGTTATDGGLVGQYGSDLVLYNYEAGIIQFGTSNAERARIDSSGNLLVGTTTPLIGKMTVSGGITTTGYPQFNIYSTNSSTDFEWVLRTGARQLYYVNNASVVASLSLTGVWTNASDARYKENITDSQYGLATVMALKPRAYNLIDQADKPQIGFIAQEVLDVVPEVVDSVHNSVTDEDRYTLSYGNMVAVLTKAIQEQQAIIQTLTDRITALEGTTP